MDESGASPIPDKIIENILSMEVYSIISSLYYWSKQNKQHLSNGKVVFFVFLNKAKVFSKHRLVQSIELVEIFLEPRWSELEPVV